MPELTTNSKMGGRTVVAQFEFVYLAGNSSSDRRGSLVRARWR